MTLSRHCVHSLSSFGLVGADVHIDQYCCWCGEKRAPEITGHEPEPGHGPHLDQVHSRALWTDPWQDACPKHPEGATVSQETTDRRTRAVLEEFGPMIAESVRLTKELSEHPNHEWGAVVGCRLCQEEKVKA